MKRQKLFRPRIPWWTWDAPFEKPPWRGIMKKIGNRIARRRAKQECMREYKND